MGGGITNVRTPLLDEPLPELIVGQYYYPYQAIRTVRGLLTDYLPTWLPLRAWIVGRRYACIVLSLKKDYLETVPAFLAFGNEVIIDSVFKFEVSKG